MKRIPAFLTWLAIFVGVLALYLLTKDAHAQIPREAETYRREYIRVCRSEWGLDAPCASLAAMLHQESAWNHRATSRVGAAGLAQFMPATAIWIGEVNPALRGADVYSPAWSMRAQVVYMAWLRKRVKADNECERMAFSMSAYNGGLGYVFKRQKMSSNPGKCFGMTCEINPGILPANQKENAHYPRRILLELESRYELAGWGLGSCS